MAFSTPCPHCHRTGFVRLEHVITGGRVVEAYYCGACDHHWEVQQVGSSQRRTRRSASRERPDRSRS